MKKILAGMISAIFCLGGCSSVSQEAQSTAQEDIQVVTSFYPIYILALNITDGVEGVSVTNMTQPQTGCLHDYELTTEDMKQLETADLFLINGLGMEGFLGDVMEQYPDVWIGDTSEGAQVLSAAEHDHDHGAEETEGNAHIWLNPTNAVIQAENIRDFLTQADPAHAVQYEQNAQKFAESMTDVIRAAEALAEQGGRKAAVFHEGFAYLADVCAIEAAVGIYADENEEPSAQEMAQAADVIQAEGITLFLTSEDAGKKYADTLAAESTSEASVVILNPLTSGDENKDAYRLGMEENLEVLSEALS